MGYGYPVGLRGESHHQAAIAALRVGDEVMLAPDPTNPHDPRAVRATFRGEAIGYAPRDNWTARVLYDEGGELAAVVRSLATGDAEMTGVVLSAANRADLPEVPTGLPLPKATLPLRCACGTEFSASVLGITTETRMSCPACGEPTQLDEDQIAEMEIDFLTDMEVALEAAGFEVPDDTVLYMLRRIGRWPTLVDLLEGNVPD